MANGWLAVSWGIDGRLTSIIDVVRGRELLRADGGGVRLQLHDDHPVNYDAWDLESWTVDNGRDVAAGGAGASGGAGGEPHGDLTDAASVTVEATGPLVGAVAVTNAFGGSITTVRYVLRAGSPRLDLEVDIDWHETEKLLSLRLPLDVRSDTVECGVQFGHVSRPTHRSTSWDAAKFEICAHRWVDLAEPSFGVAVLDNGRYGHGVVGGDVRVSLARAARYPDPAADQGRHQVTLAVFPHGPGLADVVAEAERLEYPLRLLAGAATHDHDRPPRSHRMSGATGDSVTRSSAASPPPPAARPSAPAPSDAPVTAVVVRGRGIEVDAVKPADDASGAIVVRLHEALGDRGALTVAAPRRIVAATRCNLLEEALADGAFEVSDGIVAATVRPFELVTLRLELAPADRR